MKNYSSYTERDAFNEALFNTISDYLKEKDSYSTNAVLAINKKSKVTEYGEPADFDTKWDIYSPEKFIRTGDNNETEHDIDETFELASQYYFVR